MLIKRIGYGQVEPNHLSAQRNGQIYAQYRFHNVENIPLENGTFLVYDPIFYNGTLSEPVDLQEGLLVLNEIKLYDNNYVYYKDNCGLYSNFAMKGEDIFPRVVKTNVGDIITTNAIGYGDGWDIPSVSIDKKEEHVYKDFNVGDLLALYESRLCKLHESTSKEECGMLWKVIELTSLADGQPAVKIQRIK